MAMLMKGEFMIKKAFSQWKKQTKKGQDDELRTEVLRLVYNQAITSRMIKGFKKW